MFVVLIPFFACAELQKIAGEGKLAQIFSTDTKRFTRQTVLLSRVAQT